MELRKEVLEFAEEMERIMSLHDPIKGNSWRADPSSNCDDFLWEKLGEEYEESVNENADVEKELIDLANIAMMLWWRKKNKLST